MVRNFVAYKTLFMLALQLSTSSAKRDFFLVFSQLECHNNLPSLIDVECHLKQRGNRSYIDGRILPKRAFHQVIINSVFMPMSPYMSQLSNFNLTTDGCRLLKEAPKQFMWKLGLQQMRKFLNEMPKSCPLKTNFNYTVTDSYIDEESLPSFAPEGKYRFDSRVSMLNMSALHIFGQINIVYPKKKRFR